MASTAIVPVRIGSGHSGGAAIVRARKSGGSRKKKTKVSAAAVKQRARTRTLALGGLASFAFGLLQKRVDLPSVENVPDTLTYGGIGTVAGMILKSDTLVMLSMGPLFTGLNQLGKQGFQPVGRQAERPETGTWVNPETGKEEVLHGYDDVSGDLDGL